MKERESQASNISSNEKDKAQKKLFKLTEFYLWLMVPLIMAVLSGIVIVCNSNFICDFTYEGFNNFIIFFRAPLGIAALVFPSVALVASNHRSRQAGEQIRTQMGQNIFANHYNHMEKFEEYCNKLDSYKSGLIKFGNLRIYHEVMFPSSSRGSFSINTEFFDEAATRSAQLSCIANKIVGSRKDRPLSITTYQTEDLNEFIAEALGFLTYLNSKLLIPMDSVTNLNILIKAVWDVSDFLERASCFDGALRYDFKKDLFSKFDDLVGNASNSDMVSIEEFKKKEEL